MGKYAGFTSVELTKPKKSLFDLSHDKKLTLKMGRLVPIFCAEAIPGDKFNVKSEVLVRFMALLAPVFAQINVTVHYFFVPNRLLWSEWENFITAGRLGYGVDTAPVPPYFRIKELLDAGGGWMGKNSLWDYLGGPATPDSQAGTWNNNAYQIDAMPFIAYNKIYMDYYRDRNFYPDDMRVMPAASGLQDPTNNDTAWQLYQDRDWAKDYFTSALPWTQRGSEVLIPLEGVVGAGDVTYLDSSLVFDDTGANIPAEAGGAGSPLRAGRTAAGSNPQHLSYFNVAGGNLSGDARIENIDEISWANSSITINDLRSAVQLQKWLERNAVAGSRYTESIQAHFGVRPQDSRLQRAEYLGGGRVPVKIAEVVNTAFSYNQDDDIIPSGNLAGHGISYGDTNGFNYYCSEHGFIMGIMSIMPVASYQQGIPRMFKRKSFLDYPWPTFAHLGEQPVNQYELYFSPATMTEDAEGNYPVMGYQSRYADWKWMPSTTHGEFRDTLDFWTLTRTFNAAPTTPEDVIPFEVDIEDRIFAVNAFGAASNIMAYVFNRASVVRALPYFGTPQL